MGWRGAKLPGKRARLGVPVTLYEMRPVRGTRGAPDRPPCRARLQ